MILKSARIGGRIGLAVAAALALSACTTMFEDWFGETDAPPPPPRAGVQRPAPVQGEPNLASVPNRPATRTSPDQRRQIERSLAADRENARYTDEQLRGRAAPAPPAAPARQSAPPAAPTAPPAPTVVPPPPTAVAPMQAASRPAPAPVAVAPPAPAPAAGGGAVVGGGPYTQVTVLPGPTAPAPVASGSAVVGGGPYSQVTVLPAAAPPGGPAAGQTGSRAGIPQPADNPMTRRIPSIVQPANGAPPPVPAQPLTQAPAAMVPAPVAAAPVASVPVAIAQSAPRPTSLQEVFRQQLAVSAAPSLPAANLAPVAAPVQAAAVTAPTVPAVAPGATRGAAGSVRFLPNGTLDGASAQVLRGAAQTAMASGARLRAVGFAQMTGNDAVQAFNQAMERALVVQRELVRYGVPANSVATEARVLPQAAAQVDLILE